MISAASQAVAGKPRRRCDAGFNSMAAMSMKPSIGPRSSCREANCLPQQANSADPY